MELIVRRFYDNHYSTTGILFVDGSPFCVTLEPPFRHKKIMGDTRIPCGKYGLEMNYDSPKALEYKTNYGIVGLPRLKDVPDFEGILIHIGNYKRDTEGCILVGDTLQVNILNGFDRQKILNSKITLIKLIELIESRIKEEKVYITILDD